MRTRVLQRTVILGLVGLGLTLASIPFVRGTTPVSAASAVPYTDPAANGYVGLCNQQGQQITSGSTSTAPFAWRAVSSAPAPASYAGPTRTAILMAYQPIQYIAPGDWSGDALTASARYSNPANPMTAATGADESLDGYMIGFQPRWDGFLQLRIYLGAANEQGYSLHYPTLDIKVTGNTWTAVDGGPVNCASGTAVSFESTLLPSSDTSGSTTTTSRPSAATTTSRPGTTTAVAAQQGGTTGSSQPQHSTTLGPSQSAGSTHSASSSGAPTGLLIAVAAVVLAIVAAVLLLRSRRRGAHAGIGRLSPGAPGSAGPSPDHIPPTKGTS